MPVPAVRSTAVIACLLAGFASSMALIVAIGSQNAFVLRQGLRREHALAVILTCALSDALLISVGVAGLGGVLAAQPGLISGIRWVAVAFLLGYAVLAIRRALRPEHLDPAGAPRAT